MYPNYVDEMWFFSDDEFMEAIDKIAEYAIHGIEPSSKSANVNAWCMMIKPLIAKADKNYDKQIEHNKEIDTQENG